MTLKELNHIAARRGLSEDTEIVTPSFDHSFRSGKCSVGMARFYPDGHISEDDESLHDDEGETRKVIVI